MGKIVVEEFVGTGQSHDKTRNCPTGICMVVE